MFWRMDAARGGEGRSSGSGLDASAGGRAARCGGAGKDLDNDHAAAAARAWRTMIGGGVRIGGVVHCRRINLRHWSSHQVPGVRNVGLAAGARQQPVVADAMSAYSVSASIRIRPIIGSFWRLILPICLATSVSVHHNLTLCMGQSVGEMARPIGKLTALDVSRARPPCFLNDGGGLYLLGRENLVADTSYLGWIFRYKMNGWKIARDMGLGPYPDVPLAEARELATQCRRMLRDGIDPIEARRAKRKEAVLNAAKAVSFRQCGESFIAAHKAGWRNAKHAVQWSSTLKTYVYPIFGDLSVQAIDVGLVLRVLEPIWTVKSETASRVRGRIEAVLDWATARGHREGANPARWRGHLDKLLPKKSKVHSVEHHAALPYAEIGTFMVELRQQDSVGARAFEFAIVTAARTGEVIGAQWTEFNLAERLWTVPAKRMKAGKEHRVPLSDTAMAILTEMSEIRQSDYVFPGAKSRRPLSNMTFLMLLRRMGRSDLTAHGFRSTFSDWCSERTNFPTEVREMALAHTVSDKVEAAYRRGDLFQKRRQVMGAWARFATTVPAGTGEVVTLAAAR